MDTNNSDSSHDDFDEFASAAGAALRRSAPSGGLASVRSSRRRRRATQVVGATGAVVLVGVAGALILRTTLNDSSPQVVSDTSPVTSTAISTTTEPPPTTPPTSSTLPVVDSSGGSSETVVAEGRFGGPLRDEGCDWVLGPTPDFVGVSLRTTRLGGQGTRNFFAGSEGDDVWVDGVSVCESAAIVAAGGVRDDVTRIVVRAPDGDEITLEVFDIEGKPWNAVLGEYPSTWFDMLNQTGEIILFAGNEVVAREPYQLLGANNSTGPAIPSADSSALDESATDSTTTGTQATTTSGPAPATSPATTSPSSNETLPTTEPPAQQALEQVAVWPAADVVFDTPEAAAGDFVAQVLGAGVVGVFEQINERSGEIEIRSDADAPPGTTFPRARLQLRKLDPTNGWYVISATSEGASISLPSAGVEVPAGPVTVEGQARGSESTVNVFAFAAGPDYSALDDIDAVLTSGGAFEQTDPFSATIDLSQASPGDVITILVRGDTGLSDDPGEFAATAIIIAPTS